MCVFLKEMSWDGLKKQNATFLWAKCDWIQHRQDSKIYHHGGIQSAQTHRVKWPRPRISKKIILETWRLYFTPRDISASVVCCHLASCVKSHIKCLCKMAVCEIQWSHFVLRSLKSRVSDTEERLLIFWLNSQTNTPSLQCSFRTPSQVHGRALPR